MWVTRPMQTHQSCQSSRERSPIGAVPSTVPATLVVATPLDNDVAERAHDADVWLVAGSGITPTVHANRFSPLSKISTASEV